MSRPWRVPLLVGQDNHKIGIKLTTPYHTSSLPILHFCVFALSSLLHACGFRVFWFPPFCNRPVFPGFRSFRGFCRFCVFLLFFLTWLWIHDCPLILVFFRFPYRDPVTFESFSCFHVVCSRTLTFLTPEFVPVFRSKAGCITLAMNNTLRNA